MKKLDLAYKVSIISIIVNVILFILKLIAGIIGHSKAMISDAIHSASDIISTIIVIIGIFISRKQSDEKHPYGHEKFECIAAIILSAMLFGLGISICLEGINSIIHATYLTTKTPTLVALTAAIVSIITKEWMYRFTVSASIKENSNALHADAWHHRSDALSSIGALIGIGASMLGFKIFDPIASIIIAVCIIKAAFDILIDGINKMVDTSASNEVLESIAEIIKREKKIKNIDSIKTRLFGSKLYVDLEIAVDKNLTLIEAHDIAHSVHDSIEENIKNCKHCMVHVNPYNAKPNNKTNMKKKKKS